MHHPSGNKFERV